MHQAVARLDGFDHVFVDTPGLPWHPREMRDALAALKPLMECLVPVQTHFVIDATRALEEVDIDILRRMPVSPDIVALTHIDETARPRSEEHTSELQSRGHLVCSLLLE